jgi:coproporphyrinogen III oxidase-like Fe-S oxidoreductase
MNILFVTYNTCARAAKEAKALDESGRHQVIILQYATASEEILYSSPGLVSFYRTRDDLLRRAVIMALMCQGRVDFESIELAHLVEFRVAFAAELTRLAEMQGLGLVTVSEHEIQVTATGWYFVRAVAMVFDKYLKVDQARAQFSRII